MKVSVTSSSSPTSAPGNSNQQLLQSLLLAAKTAFTKSHGKENPTKFVEAADQASGRPTVVCVRDVPLKILYPDWVQKIVVDCNSSVRDASNQSTNDAIVLPEKRTRMEEEVSGTDYIELCHSMQFLEELAQIFDQGLAPQQEFLLTTTESGDDHQPGRVCTLELGLFQLRQMFTLSSSAHMKQLISTLSAVLPPASSPLGDTAISPRSSFCTCSNVTALDLELCNIGDGGLAIITDAICTNNNDGGAASPFFRNLTKLLLASNQITPEGFLNFYQRTFFNGNGAEAELTPFAKQVVHLGFTNNALFLKNGEEHQQHVEPCSGTKMQTAWGSILSSCSALQMVHLNRVGMAKEEAEVLAATVNEAMNTRGDDGGIHAKRKKPSMLRVLIKQNFDVRGPPHNDNLVMSSLSKKQRQQQAKVATEAWQSVHDPLKIFEL